MSPNLDEIQQVLNKATGYVLEVSRGIAQWGQERFRKATDEEKKKSKQNDGSAGKNIFLLFFFFFLANYVCALKSLQHVTPHN